MPVPMLSGSWPSSAAQRSGQVVESVCVNQAGESGRFFGDAAGSPLQGPADEDRVEAQRGGGPQVRAVRGNHASVPWLAVEQPERSEVYLRVRLVAGGELSGQQGIDLQAAGLQQVG